MGGNDVFLGASTYRSVNAADRIVAAATAGLRAVGLSHAQVHASVAAGHSVGDLRRLAAEHDVHVVEVELLRAALEPDGRERTEAFAMKLFELAAALGADKTMVVSLGFDDLDRAAARLARLCDLAAEHAVTVEVEFCPWTDVRDLSVANELVRRADRPNAGVVLDAWHFFRGRGRLETIDAAATARLTCVQLCDGPEPDPSMDVYDETRTRRLAPGEGTFDLVGLIRALAKAGYSGPWSIEVLSARHDGQQPTAVVAELVGATSGVLARSVI